MHCNPNQKSNCNAFFTAGQAEQQMATGSFAEEDLFVAVSKSCAIFLLDPKADCLIKADFRDSIIPITFVPRVTTPGSP